MAIALALILAGLALFWLAFHRGAASPAGASRPAASAAPRQMVPPSFQGEWNTTPAHCGTGVNDSALVIGPDRVAFYESGGPITKVQVHGPREITLTARLTGEGETFEQSHRYRLSADGDTLTEVAADKSGLVRRRCPLRG